MMKPIVNTIVAPIATQISYVLKAEMGDQLSDALLEGIGDNVPQSLRVCRITSHACSEQFTC